MAKKKPAKKKNAAKRTRAGKPREHRGANRKVRKALKKGHAAKAKHAAARSYERAYQTPGRGLHANAGKKKRKAPAKNKRAAAGPVSYRKVGKTGWIKATAVRFLGGGRVQVKR